MYISSGNLKIDKSCLVFNLPTSSCYGCGKQCKDCYAIQAEIQYPSVLPSRQNNLKETKKDSFISKMNLILKRTKKPYFRIHSSGDFYSQKYLNKWIEIAKQNPNIFFLAYTKKLNKLDFSGFTSLPNVNIVNSKPQKNLVNYGDMEYITMLQEKFGYDICPCGIVEEKKGEKICMNSCKLCLSSSKVAFLKH